MKSRLCLCNGTILKKDLIRFAPLMLLAGLVLWAMGLLLSEFYQYEGNFSRRTSISRASSI